MGRINKSRINFGKLSDVIQKLEKKRSIRVGILQNEGTQKVKDSNLTMADLAAVHEFGTTINISERDISVYRSIDSDGDFKYGGQFRKKNAKSTNWQEDYHVGETEIVIPTRSFLRMPLLSSEGKKALQVWSVEDKERFIDYLDKDTKSGDVLATTIAHKAYERVMQAFETEGFGNWKPTTQASRQRRKGSPDNPTLINTGDLRDAVTSKVKEL